MTGRKCFMCGFDFTTVKLKEIFISTKEGSSTSETVCDYCETLLLKHNHPMNQNLEDTPAEQGGFTKPSNPTQYPPVRPS